MVEMIALVVIWFFSLIGIWSLAYYVFNNLPESHKDDDETDKTETKHYFKNNIVAKDFESIEDIAKQLEYIRQYKHFKKFYVYIKGITYRHKNLIGDGVFDLQDSDARAVVIHALDVYYEEKEKALLKYVDAKD